MMNEEWMYLFMSVLDYQIYILICPLVPLSPRILVP